MGFFGKFDIESDFTQFFIGIAIFFIIVSFALSRVSAGRGRRKKRGGGKFDDTIVDRNRELID